jgi:hypothetical protein
MGSWWCPVCVDSHHKPNIGAIWPTSVFQGVSKNCNFLILLGGGGHGPWVLFLKWIRSPPYNHTRLSSNDCFHLSTCQSFPQAVGKVSKSWENVCRWCHLLKSGSEWVKPTVSGCAPLYIDHLGKNVQWRIEQPLVGHIFLNQLVQLFNEQSSSLIIGLIKGQHVNWIIFLFRWIFVKNFMMASETIRHRTAGCCARHLLGYPKGGRLIMNRNY